MTGMAFEPVEIPLLKVENKLHSLNKEKPLLKQRTYNKRKVVPVTEPSADLKNEAQF